MSVRDGACAEPYGAEGATKRQEASYVCNLSPDLIAKAETELNEKPEWRSRDVQALRDMVLSHPGLKSRTDDEFLLRFLRARKFDYDRAFALLLEYFTVRAKHRDIFQGCVPSKLLHVFDTKISLVLPNRDHNGNRMVFFRPGRWDHSNYPIMDVLKLNVVQLEEAIKDDATQICGIVVICDYADLTLSHVKNLDREYVKLMTSMMQDAFPMRIKAVHMCNEPSVFGIAWAVIKPFIKDKIAQRIHFHGSDLTNLHSSVGLENLPSDLGGHLPPADNLAKDWYDILQQDEENFVNLLQYSLDLHYQPSKKDGEQVGDCLAGNYRNVNRD